MSVQDPCTDYLAWSEKSGSEVQYQDTPGELPTRLTMAPEFVWGYEPDSIDEFTALEDDAPGAAKRAALDVLGIDDFQEAPGPELAARSEGLGRGAEGPAIAIYLAAATVIIGQVLTWLDAAERVGQFWRWARKRQRPPVLSLGAVVMLTAVDLERRLGSVENVRLIWAGDVGGWAERGDLGYTGEDIYGVLYARAGTLWMYVVERHWAASPFR